LRAAYPDGIQALWDQGSAGRVDQPTDAIALRRDGSELAVEATVWIVEVGQTRQLTTLIRDVSARKRAERSLAEARERAIQESRLKSESLIRTSAGVRTPASDIKTLTDLLGKTDLDATQRRYGEDIRTAADAVLRVIDGMRDHSGATSASVEEADFDLREVVEDVVVLVAESARTKGVEVLGYCRPGLPETIRSDPAGLRQVLLNLAANAVRFTDRGEVVIRAGWAAAADPSPSSAVRFEVADTGIGMAPEGRARLFDPAAPGSRRGDTGLVTAKRLVEAMGGELIVDSELGHGSTFSFAIPLHPRQSR
jgi:signal transduction histidine kinase